MNIDVTTESHTSSAERKHSLSVCIIVGVSKKATHLVIVKRSQNSVITALATHQKSGIFF